MMRMGVAALLDPLAARATPTTVVVAPRISTTDARKLFDW
jgi:hypothetical protein